MFTSSDQARQEYSEGSLLFDAMFGSVLGDAFDKAVEQSWQAAEFAGEVREDRANGFDRGNPNQFTPFFL